jgi:hypothetical protein
MSFRIRWIHISNYLTAWSWNLFEKLPVAQLFKNFLILYRTWKIITVFRRALHWSQPLVRWIHSILLRTISLRSVFILSSNPRLGLYIGHFPSGFHTKILYALPNTCYMLCRSYSSWLDNVSYIWPKVHVMKAQNATSTDTFNKKVKISLFTGRGGP